MKTGQSFNQLVLPKGLRGQVMSVNHESAFSRHLGGKKDRRKKYSETSGHQLGFAVPAMYVREPSREVMSRGYH